MSTFVAKQVKPFNPFYPLLIVTGLVFSLTACAYGVMTVKMLDPAGVRAIENEGPSLMQALDEHGLLIMGVELSILGVVTFLLMGTDDFWTRRADAKQARLNELAEKPVP